MPLAGVPQPAQAAGTVPVRLLPWANRLTSELRSAAVLFLAARADDEGHAQ